MRNLVLSAAVLATAAWSQDIPQIQTNVTPVTIYQIKPAAPTTTLVYGDDFRVRLDRGQTLPDGPVRVRVFEGPRDRLIDAANRTTIGDCVRYEPIFSTPAVIEDHTLYLPDVARVSDVWVGQGGNRRFVLVPEDGKQPAGTVWLDRASAADYFNRGIEVEVGTGGREIPALTLWTPDPYIVEHMPPPASTGPGTVVPVGWVTSINCLKASGAAAGGPTASMTLSVCEVGM